MSRSRRNYNLCSKCVDNSSVAEYHQRQWQEVADKNREKSTALRHGIVLVDGKSYARSLYDICSHSGERNLNCWYDDPDQCDCSIHEILLQVQLQSAQYHGLLYSAYHTQRVALVIKAVIDKKSRGLVPAGIRRECRYNISWTRQQKF